jgi:ribosome-binding factor A
MARGGREVRIGQEIQRLLAELLRAEVKDPRISALVTITAVDVTRDLAHAQVYVTLLGSEAACEETLNGLNRCAPFMRRALSQRMRLRSVPELKFVFDASVDRGAHVTRLIESAVRDLPADEDHETRREL